MYIGEYGKNKILCAVMDGCTTALESHFASTLIGKILRKICLEKGYKEFIEEKDKEHNIEDDLKSILRDLLNELKIVKNQLMLDSKELLSTLIIMLVDKNNERGVVLAIGDGFVNINGEITDFEQDNKPDYLGFHLSEDFETFYNSQTQKIIFSKLTDLSISTDGIFTFEKVVQNKSDQDINVIEFLTAESSNSDNEEMLNLKLKTLENEFGLKPTDDFSIIRLIKF